jgi:uroporphyrinogen decarboxylase
MGNDFGSQLDMLVSPELFKKFILPGFKKNVELAKKYGKKVMLHSCGSIHRIIPLLIDIGVDALHPLQARAAGMDAVSLAKQFKGKIAFVGGVDTQDLLVNATPAKVKDEVRRLKDIFGANFVISPSHEAVLPNIPIANIEAMVLAALES